MTPCIYITKWKELDKVFDRNYAWKGHKKKMASVIFFPCTFWSLY